MLIYLLILAFGFVAATASVLIAVRLVPPMGKPLLRHEAQPMSLSEARWIAEQEMKDEIDALRQVMLEQRVEIMQLRRREERRKDLRSQELEQRKRRGAEEAQFLREQPVAAVPAGHVD